MSGIGGPGAGKLPPFTADDRAPAGECPERGEVLLRSYSAQAEPVLSIIIPTYNTARWVRQAIDSALAQTLTEVEVVVVDDGSTDESLDQALAVSDPRLTIVAQRNGGLSAARNTGIRAARAALLGFLDADDEWLSEKAERQVLVHRQLPGVGLTFSWSVYIDESGADHGRYLITHTHAPTARDLTQWNHVGNGSTAIVRRECFEQAGLFDEQLRSCEDLDMWVRIAAKTHYSLRLVPEILTRYRVRQGSLSLTFDTFLAAAELLRKRLAHEVPGLNAKDADRCFAQMLRIASRKALAAGQVKLSRKLLREALLRSPSILLSDRRAVVLTGIHSLLFWLPDSAARAGYRVVDGAAGRLHTRMLKGNSSQASDKELKQTS